MRSILKVVNCWRRSASEKVRTDCASIRSRAATRWVTRAYFGKLLAFLFIVVISIAGAAVRKPAKTVLVPPIDLNTASPRDLQTLPGVGAATAKKIVAGRPYASAKDLAKAGVSRKIIAKITPMVTTSGFAGASSVPVPPPPTPGMVWVNLETKRYHKEGSRWFGTTGKGKYMTEADAQRAGYRASKD